MEFQQSRTYSNLLNAYDAELMTSTKNLVYGEIARQEGYIAIAQVYETIARNNKEHARIWLRRLNEGNLPNTESNLQASIDEATYTGNELYREYARIAREEGFNDIAALFNGVANIDLNHSLEFRTLYDDLIRNQLFCKPTRTLWICLQCGNILSGECAPVICPICGFPQGYYWPYTEVSR